MPHAVHVPDRAIVAALQRIDPKLTVSFEDPPGRWAVWHDLLQGDLEKTVEEAARTLQEAFQEAGHTVPFPNCQQEVYERLKQTALVFYVTDDDGSYRSLDNRAVQKMQRMWWLQQNLGVGGIKNLLRVRAEAAKESRDRDKADVWDQINHDRVFKRQVSDILWGMKPARSVFVKGLKGIAHANHS